MKKIDSVKILSIASTVLAMVGAFVSTLASKREMNAKIAEEVAKYHTEHK